MRAELALLLAAVVACDAPQAASSKKMTETSQPAGRPASGQPAPEFAAPASTGKTVSLSEFKGKQSVVLAFFPKAFTGG